MHAECFSKPLFKLSVLYATCIVLNMTKILFILYVYVISLNLKLWHSDFKLYTHF